MTVVLAAGSSTRSAATRGAPIDGVERGRGRRARSSSTQARRSRGDGLVTNGGRILSVTGPAPTLAEARERAYAAAGADLVRGRRYRTRHRGGEAASWLTAPLVGILVGSESDATRMQAALDELDARGIAWEFEVRSAHRTPNAVAEYCDDRPPRAASSVLIAGAGPRRRAPGRRAPRTPSCR